jgi:hypothetical protein
MATQARESSMQAELLLHMTSGKARIKGGRWAIAWRKLVEGNASDVQAEHFFTRIQHMPHPSGSTAFMTRASEGRRVFAYAKTNPSHALQLLKTLPYHRAIKEMPILSNRGRPASSKKSSQGELVP